MIDKIIDLAKNFIYVPSIHTNPLALRHILLDAKDQLPGFICEEFLSNNLGSLLISNRSVRPERFKIILNAHLDVIEGREDQFTPIVKNGRLYGRGAYDMKTTAAAMIILFKTLADKVTYPLGLQLTTDEEMNGEDGTRFQLLHGVRSDFAILGESGSNFRIINEAKSPVEIKLTASGLSAHGAYPWKGNNAINLMSQTLERISERFPTPKSESYDTTINIGRIETSNKAVNKVPDNCIAFLDVRVPMSEKDTALKKIQSLLPQGVTLEILFNQAHHFTNPDNEYILKLKSVTEKVLNQKTAVIKQFATSDARFFTEVNCPAIEFGPIGGGQHEDEEWVDIESVDNYYQILSKFLLSLN